MIQGPLSFDDRVRKLGLLSLEKRRLLVELTMAFQYLKGAHKHKGNQLFI